VVGKLEMLGGADHLGLLELASGFAQGSTE
jgi:hypothetical protein